MASDSQPSPRESRFADAVPHRRTCMFCGGRATVFGAPEWDDLDVDAEFASEGRSFSDVADGEQVGVGCTACSRMQWAKEPAAS